MPDAARSSESVIAPRRSSCASGSTSRRAAWPTRCALVAGRGSAREAVVLSTCNRAGALRRVRRGGGHARTIWCASSAISTASPPATSRRTSTTSPTSTSRATCFASPPASTRWSMGEPQILGQVKDAHTVATDARTAGPVLNRLFHCVVRASASACARETGLGSGAVSVSYAAVALARKIFGDLGGRSVAVIGAGEMGKLTALHMKSQAREARHDRQPHDGARGADGGGDRRRQRRAVGGARRGPRRQRHRHHRHRRGGADPRPRRTSRR